MRVPLGIALLCHVVFSYDAVLFSNSQELSAETPSLESLISGASAEHPLIFLVEPDFTIGLFNKHASVYQADGKASPLAQMVREAKYSAQRHLDATYEVPNAQAVSQTGEYQNGASTYLVSADDWSLLEELSANVLSKVNSFTAVLANSEAVTQSQGRVKRLSSDVEGERGERAADADPTVRGSLPVTIPPYNRTSLNGGLQPMTNRSCLLYMEGISIIATKIQGEVPSGYPAGVATISGENGTFYYEDGDVICATQENRLDNGIFTFVVRLSFTDSVTGTNVNGQQFTVPGGQNISFRLVFKEDVQFYWALDSFTLLTDIKIAVAEGGKGFIDKETSTDVTKFGNASGIGYMGVNGVVGYSWNCGDSAAAWFPTKDDSVRIGIAFHNFQVQLRNIHADKSFFFDRQVVDCVPTFSTGSLMGIISALIMLSIFIFGFLMLNSVQTMDRFDDPKQKQILINVRE
ncbi:unnamed protein product, partial [Mesorhabditis belari]|uniref:V-type proton ATPase subunit S1/VOA1 transmembrane domain-containing protein n=1 Tax=Mesorhabditis belari TaxID=2138241 RepID=A0AAF3FFL8_9BILA